MLFYLRSSVWWSAVVISVQILSSLKKLSHCSLMMTSCRTKVRTLYTFYFRYLSRCMTKQTIWPVRPAKTQVSLGIHPVWSEFSLCSQWVAKDLKFLHVDSEDSDQTGRIPRLVWVFAGCTGNTVGFVMRRLIWFWFCHEAAYLIVVVQILPAFHVVFKVSSLHLKATERTLKTCDSLAWHTQIIDIDWLHLINNSLPYRKLFQNHR